MDCINREEAVEDRSSAVAHVVVGRDLLPLIDSFTWVHLLGYFRPAGPVPFFERRVKGLAVWHSAGSYSEMSKIAL